MHLHQRIYSRLARIAVGSKNPANKKRRNNLVALYILAGATLFTVFSLLVWRSAPALITLGLCFWGGYPWLYFRLARWRAPAWMIISPKARESS